MKFTLDWLKDHLETTADAQEIATALTTIGLEVESVEEVGARLKAFVVAHVVSAEPHPNSDHLNVCKVDAGTGTLIDVVCGAPNAKTGMKSVFAFPGTYIPGKDFMLKEGVVIRGQVSNGMLCSAAELELSNDHDGIIKLPDDAPIGMSYVDYAKLGGAVIDISITPNRGDATGVYGVARDLAAFGVGTLKPTDMSPVSSKGPSPIAPLPHNFAPGEPKAIRKFAGRLIRNVENGPSPEWLQKRLRDVGLRPINKLADITNLVSLGWGRPLHAYDADTFVGAPQLRNAKAGEKLDGLDGREHTLSETMCVIADDAGPACLGGILGGVRTSCTDGTTSIFMECASWDPELIARTGRDTGIVSDARYRLERSVDPALTEPGLELATRLVLDLCGGEPMEPVISGEDVFPNTVIDFPLSEVKRLTGLDASAEEIVGALTRLGFAVEGTGERRQVKVPSWRPDVTQKADLAEEAMRMIGVDNVPVDPLPRLAHVAPRMLTTIQNRRRLARRVLASRGIDEAINWSFIPAADAERFGGGKPELKLANPIAAELTDMRPSLLPGLLAATARNENRGAGDLSLFEVGQVFLSVTPDGQHTYATAVRSGGNGRNWRGGNRALDVFDAKADLAALLDAMGHDIDKLQVVAEPPAWSHPGRGGAIKLGPKLTIATFGEVHPDVLAAYDLTGPVVAFEADLDAIPEPRRKPTRSKPAIKLSGLMPVSRDFAFLVSRETTAAAILKAARGADKALIADASIFDVFEGKGIAEGKKSVGVEIVLQPQDRTLTDEDIEKVSDAVVTAIVKATGGVLRT
ncbi:MAG TPA: phenylalanine--tRNA ligase subunit beta [Devosia sp.]|nr:phenylalanine--tRNA ligase subunit beta [Devosia sp.]